MSFTSIPMFTESFSLRTEAGDLKFLQCMRTLKYFYFSKFHRATLQCYQFTGKWVFFLERPWYKLIIRPAMEFSTTRVKICSKIICKVLQNFSTLSFVFTEKKEYKDVYKRMDFRPGLNFIEDCRPFEF